MRVGACINGVFTRAEAADSGLPPESDRSYPIAALLGDIVRKADPEALFRKHDTDAFFHMFQVGSYF